MGPEARRGAAPPGPFGGGTESPAPAKLDDPPAARREHRAELAGARVGNDAVERPAGHVDDPEDAPQPLHRFLRERLPDVTPLQPGVAHPDHEPPPDPPPPLGGDRPPPP